MDTPSAADSLDPIHLCLGVEKALLAAAEGQNGFSGNCAKVAVILNEVLEGDGDYVVVTGEHYEYADHVFWCWQDRLWDMKGFVTREEAEGAWCQEGEQLEDFEGDDVVRLVDPNNVFAGGFDANRFKQALVDELTKAGLPVNPELTPSSPKAKGPFGPF